jgi:hypothetical protein
MKSGTMGEEKNTVAAKNQRRQRGGLGAEHGQRQSGPISDIAVGASRKDSLPANRPTSIARTKAVMVPSAVAIRNGGLFSSGSPLPQAKPMKMRPK